MTVLILKRLKNINFDVGLGFATDLVPGIAKFFQAQEGMFQATRFVPENEAAEQFFKNVNVDDPTLTLEELVEDTVNKGAVQRAESLDEVLKLVNIIFLRSLKPTLTLMNLSSVSMICMVTVSLVYVVSMT